MLTPHAAPKRVTLGHSRAPEIYGLPEIQFSQFSGGTTVDHVPCFGFGSGPVREILGCDFY